MKEVFLSSIQLTEQLGQYSYPGMFSLSHRVISASVMGSIANRDSTNDQ